MIEISSVATGPCSRRARASILVLAAVALTTLPALASSPAPAGPPTVKEAGIFVHDAEVRLQELIVHLNRVSWVKNNFITEDTVFLEAEANEELLALTAELAKGAARFNGLTLPEGIARKLHLLKVSLALAAPDDEALRKELAQIAAEMDSMYGAGKYCPGGGRECMDLTRLGRVMAESRDAAALLDAWTGWHSISPPMRPMYQRFVELGNRGARELGFADLGAMWRSSYDMPPDDFEKEVDRLWSQVRPLYEALHCHVRASLGKTYGTALVPPGAPIPAHLLGNMWSQSWGNVYSLVAPPQADPGFDLTERLKAKGVDAREMVRYGERFFTSLGFEPLPQTFWERSLFTKPADRDVTCHASAWDIDNNQDLRIKMCIEINDEDFSTVHHELGHNIYQRAYRDLPTLFQGSAHDGFHEGLGDTIALSVTPEYLKTVGLIDTVPGPEGDLGLLMRMALDKVAFLPFGLLVDQWRWKVFAGEIPPERYNQGWWELRTKYQGIAPPVARNESDFDAGAKYHVPANTPYTRYFLAHILQFQLHRSLCAAAGYKGPLHRCSIYGDAEAGRRLKTMMEMGLSRPWPEALTKVGGGETMDATAILDYFKPLKAWLDEQNASHSCGW